MVRAKAQQNIADKFTTQLDQILKLPQVDGLVLNERVTKAKAYFSKTIHEELISPVNGIQAFFKGKTKVKQLARATDELETLLWKKLNEVQRITFGEFTFDVPLIERQEQPKAAAAKTEKGSTKLQTLAFYRQGMSAEDIAKQRGFAVGTIEGHLSEFVASGEVNVFDFITKQILDEVRLAVEKAGIDSYTRIKQHVSDSTTFMHIRMACNYLKNDKQAKQNETV
ncbi:MAG: helix-turn-helix domain-containing protein, partial [Bacteroidota bacterium]